MIQAQIQKLKALYSRYERWMPVAFFILGFLFDMAVLHRIDEPAVIVQQALYIVIVGSIVTTDLIAKTRGFEVPNLLRKIWRFREFLVTFALGTLLNSFTIFYFKSASGMTSFVFIAILVAALTISEFKRFGDAQVIFHLVLLSLSLISALQCWIPMLLGYTGSIPFLISGFTALLIVALYYRFLLRGLNLPPEFLKTHVARPYAITQAVFTLLYFLHAIPPVPLSVSYMGVYHSVEKRDGEYVLGYTRPWWRFWERGDETFLARPGDTVVAYFQIFSPAGFRDQLQVRWSLYDPKRGWQSQDAIPLTITGGREEGFRATTRKSNYQPGLWRIQVETREEREVGRFGFQIIPDNSVDERTVHTEVR